MTEVVKGSMTPEEEEEMQERILNGFAAYLAANPHVARRYREDRIVELRALQCDVQRSDESNRAYRARQLENSTKNFEDLQRRYREARGRQDKTAAECLTKAREILQEPLL